MFPRQSGNAQQDASDSAPLETRHLPDGVTIHPLNENAMNELRRGNMSVLGSIGTLPIPEPDAVESAPLPVLAHAHPEIITDRLRDFIHDERNGSVFYNHLSGIAPRKDYRNMLVEISEGCAQRKKIYGDIYNGICGEDFSPDNAAVDTSVGFGEGVRWAISVENKSLRNLCDLYDSTTDALVGKRLVTQIYKKFCDLSYLHLMMP